jgi:hypothetical protein
MTPAEGCSSFGFSGSTGLAVGIRSQIEERAMSREIRSTRSRLLSLLALVAMATGLILVTWLLVRADDTPALANADVAASPERPEPSGPAQADVLSTTAYIPMVTNYFSLLPPAFGVQMGLPIADSTGLTQAKQAGVHWIRFSAFDWDKIEPIRTDPPTYNWSAIDEQSIGQVAANGMELIGIIRYAPAWAQALPGTPCGPILQDRLDEFAQFLTTLVTRYRGSPYNVRYWELGNEPDVDPSLVEPDSGFGCWGDKNDEYYGGGYYAEMLKFAYGAIKAADPNAQVLIGGLLLDCNPNNSPLNPVDPSNVKDCTSGKFMEGILLNGGGPYFDTVSFHAYTYFWEEEGKTYNPNWPGSVTGLPDKVAFLRQVLSQYGYGDKAMMNTEAALLCFHDTPTCREMQARYMPRVYAEALALGLKGQTYFSMINNSWFYTGLLEPDLTPKPAYTAYATAASYLTSVSYQGLVTGYSPSIEGYRFRQAYGPWYIDVIWSMDGSVQNLTLPIGASAYDHYGNLLAASGMFPVGSGAVYVKRP